MTDAATRQDDTTSTHEPDLRDLFRSFRRAASRLRDGLDDFEGPESARFSLSYTAGRGTLSRFDEPSSFPRLAALLRPFMAANSSIELTRLRAAVEEAGLLTDDQAALLATEFARAANLGIDVVLNERPISARDMCFAYGDGLMFDENPAARSLLDELSFGPMRDLVPFLFHTACLNYVRLVDFVAETISEVERAHPEFSHRTRAAASGRCIYCQTTERPFRSEEHVIPEAFGQDELVLKGSVCDDCNNRLSNLDQFIAEFEPLAMLRVLYVPLTKKGRFPRARLKEVDLEKTRPRHINLRHKSTRSTVTVEELPEGQVKISFTGTSRRPFDPVKLGRALFKIGLGLVASQAGPETALGPRFDTARDFINAKRRGMPGALWMPTVITPEPHIKTRWWQPDDHHTIVTISLFGLWFAFDLEGDAVGLDVTGVPGVSAFGLDAGERNRGA